MLRAIIVTGLCLLALAGPRVVAANQRIALVIGNDAYPAAPLFNPVNDARAVASALEGLGFEVVLATDVDLAGMQAALLEFGGRIEDGATTLVYYAGHGVQAKGHNYLVPVDAKLDSESGLRFETLDVADILDELEYSPSKLNVLVLDACRNNPFLHRARGASGGLAAIDAAAGTLIAYATAPGSVASDGSQGNGLYTRHFLEALQIPGLTAEAVFKTVRIGVARDSGDEQIPWESSSLTGDFIFNQQGGAPANATSPAAPVAAAGVDPEGLFWESVRDSRDPADLQAYLRRWPAGTFAELARGRLAAARAADRCDDLSGLWIDHVSDRSCASQARFTRDPDGGADAYRIVKDVCAADGALALLGRTRSTAVATLDGHTLREDWTHGPCSGTAEIELDATCTRGTGVVKLLRGGFGSCRGELSTRIERVP